MLLRHDAVNDILALYLDIVNFAQCLDQNGANVLNLIRTLTLDQQLKHIINHLVLCSEQLLLRHGELAQIDVRLQIEYPQIYVLYRLAVYMRQQQVQMLGRFLEHVLDEVARPFVEYGDQRLREIRRLC